MFYTSVLVPAYVLVVYTCSKLSTAVPRRKVIIHHRQSWNGYEDRWNSLFFFFEFRSFRESALCFFSLTRPSCWWMIAVVGPGWWKTKNESVSPPGTCLARSTSMNTYGTYYTYPVCLSSKWYETLLVYTAVLVSLDRLLLVCCARFVVLTWTHRYVRQCSPWSPGLWVWLELPPINSY